MDNKRHDVSPPAASSSPAPQSPPPPSPAPPSPSRPRFWNARRRRTVFVVAGTGSASVVVTLLVGLLIAVVVRYRDARNRVTILAKADEQGAALRLTSPSGVNVAQTLPLQQPVVLPADEYRADVFAAGRFSQSYDATLNPGDAIDWSLRFNDWRAMLPRKIGRTWTTLSLNGETSIAALGAEGIQVFDGRYPDPQWSLVLKPPPELIHKPIPRFGWDWRRSLTASGYEAYDTRPWLVSRQFDLNRDGRHDILCAARHQAWMLAISGRDGALLWAIGRGSAVQTPIATPSYVSEMFSPIEGANLHPPQPMADVNGDGTPEILATFGEVSELATNYGTDQVVPVRRYVECLSGATGESLWKRPLGDSLFEIGSTASSGTSPGTSPATDGTVDDADADKLIPVAWKWFVGRCTSSGSMGGGSSYYQNGRFVRESFEAVERNDPHAYLPGRIQVLGDDQAPRGVLVAGRNVVWVDLKTGEPIESVELPVRPYGREDWADVDGDGVAELVYLSAGKAIRGPLHRPGGVVVWSPVTKSTLWSRPLGARVPRLVDWHATPARWPQLVDLDGDGAAEVVVPDGSSRAAIGRGAGGSLPWGEVVALEGKSGVPRWAASIPTSDQQADHFVAGPDIDRDGHREVYAVSFSDSEWNIYLDVLSGRDGRRLWSKQLPRLDEQNSRDEFLMPPRWWAAQGDGWPQLLIAAGGSSGSDKSLRCYAVSAGTGRIERYGVGLHDVEITDVDGDAVEDLVTFVAEGSGRDGGGRLDTVRGAVAAPWSRIGEALVDAADFDGDGIRDLVGRQQDGAALFARSGATGKPLWRTELVESHGGRVIPRYGSGLADSRFPDPAVSFEAAPTVGLPAADDEGNITADFDGDGVLDILLWSCDTADWSSSPRPVLAAVSGRSGRVLWTSQEVVTQRGGDLFGIRVVDLDGNGTSDVLLAAALAWSLSDDGQTRTERDRLWWLLAFDGSTGRLRWGHSLVPSSRLATRNTGQGNVRSIPGNDPIWSYAPAYPIPTFDLNADGVLDCIVPAIRDDSTHLEYKAVSGSDGATLWRHVLPRSPNPQQLIAPVIVERNGRPAVFIAESGEVGQANEPPRAGVRWTAIDGRDGARLWTRRSLPPKSDEPSTRAVTDAADPGVAPPADPGGSTASSVAANTEVSSPFDQWFNFGDLNFLSAIAARPTPVRLGAGRVRFVSSLRGHGEGTLHVVDPEGEVRTSAVRTSHHQVLVVDVNGDGRDELAFVREWQLQVAPVDQLDKPLWKRPIGLPRNLRDSGWLEGFVPGRGGRPAELRIRELTANHSVVSLDARTGEELWRVVGPGESADLQRAVCLDAESSGTAATESASRSVEVIPPLVAFFALPSTQVVRGTRVPVSMKQTTETERRYPERAAARTTDDMPPGGDPRWRRPLPWGDISLPTDRTDWADTLLTLASFVALGLTLIVFPVGYVGRMIVRRQWSLRSLFVLPLLAGLALTVWRWSEGATLAEKLIAAPLSVPPTLALYWLATWMVRGHWRRLRNWLLALGLSTLVAASLIGLLLLWRDRWLNPLLPGEYYGRDGWYSLLFPTLYVMSWIMMLTIAGNRVWRLLQTSPRA